MLKMGHFSSIVRWLLGNMTIISNLDKTIQGPKVYLCARFGFLTPDHSGGVYGQRNRKTYRDFLFSSTIFCVLIYISRSSHMESRKQ